MTANPKESPPEDTQDKRNKQKGSNHPIKNGRQETINTLYQFRHLAHVGKKQLHNLQEHGKSLTDIFWRA